MIAHAGWVHFKAAQWAQVWPSFLNAVYAVAYSPDGRSLVTGSSDRTAILWDVSDRAHPARMATLSGHTDAVYAVAYSPDGRNLATGSYDGTAILWDASVVDNLARHDVALACAIAGPALSPSDWSRYVPGMPYERTCP